MFLRFCVLMMLSLSCGVSAKEFLLPSSDSGWAVVRLDGPKSVCLDKAIIEQKVKIIAQIPYYSIYDNGCTGIFNNVWKSIPKDLVIRTAKTGDAGVSKKYRYRKDFSLFPHKYISTVISSVKDGVVKIEEWRLSVFPLEIVFLIIAVILLGVCSTLFVRLDYSLYSLIGCFLALALYIFGLLLLPGNNYYRYEITLLIAMIFGAFLFFLLAAGLFTLYFILKMITQEKSGNNEKNLYRAGFTAAIVAAIAGLIPLLISWAGNSFSILPFLSMLLPSGLIGIAGILSVYLTDFLIEKFKKEKTANPE